MTKVVQPRYRQAVEDSETHDLLVRAAIRIMQAEGVGAVTTARVMRELGLKRPTFHYYFSSLDDLLLAILKVTSVNIKAAVLKALQENDPLDVLWTFGTDARSVPAEFAALALRNSKIGEAVRELILEFRTIFSEALRDWLAARYPGKADQALATTTLIQFISQGLSYERLIGTDVDYDQIRRLITTLLDSHMRNS